MTTAAAADAELVVWAQQGDLAAFSALYERHFHSVHDYVSRVAKDPMIAADVTRHTFVNAMREGYKKALEAAKVRYTMHTYRGTKHGFHNDSTPRFHKKAAKLAWKRTLALFKETLDAPSK